MKTEISAGGVLVSNVHTIWYVLVIRDMNDTLTFPKGIIEPGEDPQTAARREIREEVGISGMKLLGSLGAISYTYRRNGLISKSVKYFLFKAKHRTRTSVQREEGISEAMWLPFTEAIKNIGYPETNARLLSKAKRWLAKHPSPLPDRSSNRRR